MQQIINFSKIPDAVWAAIIASLLTLGGAWLTNRGSFKRLIKQLSHDAEQKDKERKMDLRRQVYLEATEAITANHLILSKVPDLSIPDSELSKQFNDSAASIAKVNVIGSSDTVKAVSELLTTLLSKFIHLYTKRFILIQLKQEMDTHNEALRKSFVERERLVELIKRMNLQGSDDKTLWNVINSNLEFEREEGRKHGEQLNKVSQQLFSNTLELIKECFKASKEVGAYLVPAISSIRKEMEIPFDEEVFKSAMERSWQEAERSSEEFLEVLQKKT